MKTIIPIEIAPIKKDGFHCFVNLKINDGIAVRMVLDTGASRTVFDYKLIKELALLNELRPDKDKATGIGTNSMKGYNLIIKRFTLGKLIYKNYKAGILDLDHVNKAYKQINMPKVEGILGSDLFLHYQAIINYKDKTLYLKDN